MKRALPLLGIALGTALIVYALQFGKTEEERIGMRLQALAASLAVSDGRESPTIRGARLRKDFAELFAKDVSLAIPELGAVDQGRPALVELAMQAPTDYASIAVNLEKLRIRLDDSKEHAVAVGEAHLSGVRREGSRHEDSRTVSLRLDRHDGEWRIVNVSVSVSKDALEGHGAVAPLRVAP